MKRACKSSYTQDDDYKRDTCLPAGRHMLPLKTNNYKQMKITL